MNNLLELFLNGNLKESLIDDYEKKENNNGYLEVLKANPDQKSLQSILLWMQEQNYITQLQEELDSIKVEWLYPSFHHGINHNERVLFWTYYLGLKLNLDLVSMRTVLDGAKYHDIGRTNDLLDPSHGTRSAEKIENVIEDSNYQKQENLQLLKAIIEIHSQLDKNAEAVIKKYQIQNTEQFYILFSILKDADALDRVRLTYMKKRFSSLNPAYLRLKESKELLKATHQLNEFYMKHKEWTRGAEYE